MLYQQHALSYLLVLFLSSHIFAQMKIDTLEEAGEYYHLAQTQAIPQEANRYFQKALKIYQEAELWDSVLICHNHILINLVGLEKDSSSIHIEKYLQAIIQEVHPQSSTPEPQAYTHFIAGYYYLDKIGNYELAQVQYEQALIGYRDTPNQFKTIQTLMNLGIVYTDLKFYDKASAIYRQAIKLLKGSKNTRLSAQAYNLAGASYLSNQEYIEAELMFKKSKSIFEQDSLQNDVFYIVLLYNLGVLYNELQDYLQSLIYYQQALDYLDNDSLFKAEIYNGIATVYENQKEYDKALEYYQMALALIHETQKYQGKIYQVLLYNIAKTFFIKGEYDSARDYNYKIFREFYSKANYNQQWLTYYCLLEANLSSVEQQYDIAYFYLEQATHYNTQMIGSQKRFYDLVLQLQISRQKASILAETKPSEVLNEYLFCDTLTQEILKQYHYQDNQLEFVQLSSQIYHEAMLFSLQQSEKSSENIWQNRIFFFSEKKKAQVLQIQKEKLKLTELLNIPSKVLKDENELKRKLAYFNIKLNTNHPKYAKYLDSLVKYNKLYQDFTQQTQKQYPEFYERRYTRKIPNLSEIQKSLKNNEMIISYSVGKEETLLLLIASQNVFTHKLAIKREDLVLKVDDFRGSILDMEDKDSYQLGKELYQILIQPIEHRLQGKRYLLITTEDILETFPFDALITDNNKFFLEEKLIIHNLSVSLAYQSKPVRKNPLTSFVGFAPYFKDVSEIPTLPSSVQEVKEIATLFENLGLTNDTLLGEFANKAKFLEIKDQYACIHLSTHSEFFEKNPAQNKIFFHPNSQIDNIHLYLNEIYALNIKADLLVLSSCESALGELKQGEGVLSFGRAFSYVGVPNIVYSLWQIEDALSKEFMLYFYQAILKGKSYIEALNIAKIKIIRQDVYKSPFWWAGFTIIGSH